MVTSYQGGWTNLWGIGKTKWVKRLNKQEILCGKSMLQRRSRIPIKMKRAGSHNKHTREIHRTRAARCQPPDIARRSLSWRAKFVLRSSRSVFHQQLNGRMYIAADRIHHHRPTPRGFERFASNLTSEGLHCFPPKQAKYYRGC